MIKWSKILRSTFNDVTMKQHNHCSAKKEADEFDSLSVFKKWIAVLTAYWRKVKLFLNIDMFSVKNHKTLLNSDWFVV